MANKQKKKPRRIFDGADTNSAEAWLFMGDNGLSKIQEQHLRRNSKVDANQKTFVVALRKIGASVAITSHIGNGFPDLVVGYKDRNYMIEVKTARGRLTDEQLVFASRWRGQYVVCRDLEDLALVLDLPQDFFSQWHMV